MKISWYEACPFDNDKAARARSRRSDAVAYSMETFPIAKQKDEEKCCQYRTKRLILEIGDEMAEAMWTRIPYKISPDSAPGPPADEHGNFIPLPEWNSSQPKPFNWPFHINSPKEE